MKKRVISLFITGMLAITVLAACGTTEAKTADPDEENEGSQKTEEDGLNLADTFTIGIMNNQPVPLTDEYYGITEGLLGEDVTVDRVDFQAGPDAVTALASGDIDVVFGVGSFPVVSTGTNDFDYELIAYESLKDEMWLVVRADSGIDDVESLAGHKVSASFGTGSHYDLLQELNGAGLSIGDLEIINMDSETSKAALVKGDIDGAELGFNAASQLIEDGTVTLLSKYDNDLVWVLANKEYADANPEYISKFVLALHNAGVYIEENTQEVIDNLTEAHPDFSEDFVEVSIEHLKNYSFFDLGDELTYNNLAGVYEFSLEQEVVEGTYDVDKYVNTKYAERAKELLSEQ